MSESWGYNEEPSARDLAERFLDHAGVRWTVTGGREEVGGEWIDVKRLRAYPGHVGDTVVIGQRPQVWILFDREGAFLQMGVHE